MLLIPAIDLKDGQCVRLRQGRMDDVTVFSDDPVSVARRWVDEGARRIHIVDLDGAVAGEPRNIEVIEQMASACEGVEIQVGGGVRDEDAVQRYLEAGVSYVIVGSKAVYTPHFLRDLCIEYPRHIIAGIDARDGRVAVDGWAKLSGHTVAEVAERCEHDGVEAIVFTDIAKDGMMDGFNVEATRELTGMLTGTPVIASGGICSLDDIRKLLELAEEGVEGCVIGRALYEGTLKLAEANRLIEEAG